MVTQVEESKEKELKRLTFKLFTNLGFLGERKKFNIFGDIYKNKDYLDLRFHIFDLYKLFNFQN